ncbi:MAG: hypothetical protein V9E98_07575 [Candidatus Nanopelagicales bacterium]
MTLSPEPLMRQLVHDEQLPVPRRTDVAEHPAGVDGPGLGLERREGDVDGHASSAGEWVGAQIVGQGVDDVRGQAQATSQRPPLGGAQLVGERDQ